MRWILVLGDKGSQPVAEAANSPLERVRLVAECDRLRSEVALLQEEVALLQEELRIKDARLGRIAPKHRPHYPPAERLAILALKAARGWSGEQAARRFLLTGATIASWIGRLDEQGDAALVQMPTPVNRFPDFVRAVVARLGASFPTLGSERIANMLARAGLHLARTTVRRFRRHGGKPYPRVAPTNQPTAATARQRRGPDRIVTSRAPGHTWNVDLTIVPTVAGFWVPWLPGSVAQRWPFCWWVGIVLDHFSRAVVAQGVFPKEPTAKEVCALLERAGRPPKYVITDQGAQFREEYLAWCTKHRVRPRFGAIGQHGSIAVLERFMRTLKQEGLRRIVVPLRLASMVREVVLVVRWYNESRPHMALGGATPSEVYRAVRSARDGPRFEPRIQYPTRKRKLKAQMGAALELSLGYFQGRAHLPIIELRVAA